MRQFQRPADDRNGCVAGEGWALLDSNALQYSVYSEASSRPASNYFIDSHLVERVASA